MGLSDRIFRRKSSQGKPSPSAAEGGPQIPPQATDATVILPPASRAAAQSATIAAADLPAAEQFPTPPPPPDADTPAQAAEPFSPAAQEGLSVQAEQTAAAGQAAAPTRPGFRERGRLRRRLRYLRQVRELGYRDLGGLVFDQHRFERGDAALVEAKVLAIETLDREIRSVEEVLELQTPYAELFIPGVSACARCGTLHGSDAHFCPHCGLAFGGPRAVAGLGSFNGNSPYEAEAQQAPTPTADPYNTQPGNGPTA